jgi:N-methylhydantoinase A
MEDAGRAWLDAERIDAGRRRFETVMDARYKGQNHEVQVPMPAGPPILADFLAGFADVHRREHGYAIPDHPVEIVNARLKAIGLIDRPNPRFSGGIGAPEPKAQRQVHFDDGWHATSIYDRASLAFDATFGGPAIIDEMSATTVVPAGWTVRIDAAGNLLLETAP